jgi:flagellar motor switch protein FliN
MDILDQSEIDALLSTPVGGHEDSPTGSVGLAAPDSAPDDGGPIPDQYRLEIRDDQLARVSSIKVPVVVRLANRKMYLDKILDLTVGTIIEFEKRADSELDLVANNVAIGSGNAVKCGENFGLRVIKIQPWVKRLISMGMFR